MLPLQASATRGFVPGFDYDVFVSYRHLDNEPEKWVERLYTVLMPEVSRILGEPVNFWMDPKLRDGDVLDAILKQRVRGSAVFLSVLSEGYVKSTYCKQELQWFVDAAAQTVGLQPQGRSRIVVAEMYPPDEMPEVLTKLNPVRAIFHVTDPLTNRITLHPATVGLPNYDQFYSAYKKLSDDLASLLRDLRTAQQALPAPKGKKVFLAAAPPDKETERKWLENFLLGKGYQAGGQGVRPDTRDELLLWVDKEMEDSQLAIHLGGARFGVIPDGGQGKSTAWLQYEQIRKSGKRQLVWIPEDLKDVVPDQERFLALLREAGDEQTEVLSGSFKEFSDALPDELQKLETRTSSPDRAVFLLFERSDLARQQLREMRDFFEDKGWSVVHPAFDGGDNLLRQLEAESVISTEATVIYWGSAPDSWVKQKRSAVLQALERLQTERYPAHALYLGEPPNEIKTNWYFPYSGKTMKDSARLGHLWVLGSCSAFQPASLKPLLDELLRH
jgi:hypothetical protein